MDYISAKEAANKWGVSDVIARKYCRQKRIPGAKYQNGAWLIPEHAKKPKPMVSKQPAKTVSPLSKKLIWQKTKKNNHNLYDYIQINFTYSSSRMASNRLTRNQVEDIFRKGKIRELFEPTKVSDMVEAMNHCVCIDYIIDHVNEPLSHQMIIDLHYWLMFGTVDHRKQRVTPGVYRQVGTVRRDRPMPPAEKIGSMLKKLVQSYEGRRKKELPEILDFHVQFEQIVPFEDGNGRIGRLIMFKECVRHGVTPFIIDDKRRSQYLAGLAEWGTYRFTLMQVVADAQERFERQLKLQSLRELPMSKFRKYGDSEDEEEENVEEGYDNETE